MKIKKKKNLKRALNVIKIPAICFSLVIGFYLSALVFCSSFYVHESGHIFFGLIENLDKAVGFKILNWEKCPIFLFPIPQRTQITGTTYISNTVFMFGGIILVLLTSYILSFLISCKSKNKYRGFVFLIPIIFLLNEFVGDFLCGTDNVLNKPYSICENNIFLTKIVESIPFLFIIPITFIIYPFIERLLIKIVKKLVCL